MTDTSAIPEITEPRDLALLRMAQRATFNNTVLPSGLRTPARDLIVEGTALVEAKDARHRR